MSDLVQTLADIIELYESEEGESISASDAMLILARIMELQDATHGKGGNGHAQ